MRVQGTSAKCNRWFFKLNGNECSGPMTIDAALYNNWSPDPVYILSFLYFTLLLNG